MTSHAATPTPGLSDRVRLAMSFFVVGIGAAELMFGSPSVLAVVAIVVGCLGILYVAVTRGAKVAETRTEDRARRRAADAWNTALESTNTGDLVAVTYRGDAGTHITVGRCHRYNRSLYVGQSPLCVVSPGGADPRRTIVVGDAAADQIPLWDHQDLNTAWSVRQSPADAEALIGKTVEVWSGAAGYEPGLRHYDRALVVAPPSPGVLALRMDEHLGRTIRTLPIDRIRALRIAR